jgi:mRNA-degrading endonuclease YafQ of YafQ-DinJ toxin-antitoxin module
MKMTVKDFLDAVGELDETRYHIRPDWLLVWQQKNDELILILLDTGSHADLF